MSKKNKIKSQQNNRGGSSTQRSNGRQSGRGILVIGVGLVTAVVIAMLYIPSGKNANTEFDALVAKGQSNLTRVKTMPSDGRGHLNPGQNHNYSDPFPTSGIHHRVPINPGFYQSKQRSTRLVHSVEHGHIVIYYEDPGADALKTLQKWASTYPGNWDGVVVTPATGLGSAVVLTAWRKKIRLATFNPATTAAFIDKYRGRGPEKVVR